MPSGHERTVSQSNLLKTKACMSCRRGPRATTNPAWITLINGATKRNLPVTISIDEASALMREPCAYCGTAPADDETGGIDRVNSMLGYEPGNVVACCSTCNFAKRSQTLDQFKDWIARVHKHLSL